MAKPTIRFKGYTEDWEQRKVTELLKNSSSAMKIGPFGSALKKEYFVDEGIKVYAQENAFTGDFSIGDYYITEDKYKELQSCELYPGDLVISMMGTIGACAIFPENAEKGIMNSHLLRLQFDNEVIPKYIMYLLRDSDLIRKQIDRLSVGSIMSGLSSSVVKKLVFPIPTLAEQKRIVEYLDSLNNLITLHQRKCEETKILKKYMLQKMFPQNGQKVPEIRFKGFTEDWGQRKLNEIADKVSEKNKNNEFSEPFTNSAEQGIISQKDYFDREIVNNENLNGYYIVRNDDFIYNPRISVTAPVGPINRNRLGRNGVMSPLYTVFRTHDIDNLYLEFYFKTTKWHRFMKLNGDSGARFDRFTISFTQFMEMPIPYPTLEEQQKIGEYFDSLDNLITLHQRKYEELKNIKKFMLQNMFV